MSRYLATALDGDELYLRRAIADLEKANGHSSEDIRLSSLIAQNLQQKMNELGLDPKDTTAKELYYSLVEKLKADDQRLVKTVRTLAAKKVNAAADPADGLKILLEDLRLPSDCFIIKHSSIKKILSSKPPKQVMKHLDYRSVDSLIKREPLALVILAINVFESKRYVEDFYRKYKSLTSRDFENKPLTILIPKSVKWQKVLNQIDSKSRHQIVSCFELGTLIIMPIGLNLQPGQLTATLVQTLSEINRILSASTYLKVLQVRPEFSQKVYEVATQGPVLNASLMGRSIPWRVLQSMLPDAVDLPHMNKSEFKLSKLIDRLCDKYDFLKFWKSTDFLALVMDDETVSLNILDVALNVYSKLNYEERTVANFRNNLWQELIKRYMSPDLATEAINNELNLNN
jgi:hypothetical protein